MSKAEPKFCWTYWTPALGSRFVIRSLWQTCNVNVSLDRQDKQPFTGIKLANPPFCLFVCLPEVADLVTLVCLLTLWLVNWSCDWVSNTVTCWFGSTENRQPSVRLILFTAEAVGQDVSPSACWFASLDKHSSRPTCLIQLHPNPADLFYSVPLMQWECRGLRVTCWRVIRR